MDLSDDDIDRIARRVLQHMIAGISTVAEAPKPEPAAVPVVDDDPDAIRPARP